MVLWNRVICSNMVDLTTELCLQVSTVRRCWCSLSCSLISDIMRFDWPSNRMMMMGCRLNSSKCRRPCLETNSVHAAVYHSNTDLVWCSATTPQSTRGIKLLWVCLHCESLTWSYWSTSPAQDKHKRATWWDAESDWRSWAALQRVLET